ncbi:MAG TPA: acyl-CoA desaturase [Flavobacteriales bacterium]|jgi:linoleoyl-CoA desaturase|nr:acyl-CoA desaturase [Flavobacteriales bacterium]
MAASQTFKAHKFVSEQDSEFYSVLRKRVRRYFEEGNISTFGDRRMYIKTAFMLAIYLVPFGFIVSGTITSPWLYLATYVFMGFGMAGMGLSVMHDAIHGAYSKHKWVNQLLGNAMNLIGGNSDVWRMQHNVLHHTYTNVLGMDDDINTPPILRFSPHEKWMKAHKYQYLYVWFFYGISTFTRVTLRDPVQVFWYWNNGLIKSKKEFAKIMANLIFWKIFHFTYLLVLPIYFNSFSPWLTLGAYFLMHVVAGSIMSMIFQTAHVMPDLDHKKAREDRIIEENWAVHEMKTTSNYAPNNKMLTWYVGGLNFQVEHHLFANICHIHYPKIAPIVVQTAKEYNIKYHSQPSLAEAVKAHARGLYELGNNPNKR